MVKMHMFTLKSCGDLVMTREIRDPLYNYVHLTMVENAVVDSKIFQRLDGIAQMSTAHFVYPGGKYSRKCHSLGAMHLMSKALLHVLYIHSANLREEISPLLFGEPVVFKRRDTALDHIDQNINQWWDSKKIESKSFLVNVVLQISIFGWIIDKLLNLLASIWRIYSSG